MTRTLKICVGTVLAAAIVGGCAALYDKPMADKKMTMAGTQSRAHIGHVMTGWKDTPGGKGPGLGYGVVKAAGGAAKHIQFAAKSSDASKNVKLHATHVAASANNAVDLAKKIVAFVREMKNLTDEIIAGDDANGDGKVSWKKGEGGLAQADNHMGFMMKAEKM